MSNQKNNQWRQVERIAIKRAERIARNLERIMFVIYDNEEEQYDIITEQELDHLTCEFDLDFDFIAEVA